MSGSVVLGSGPWADEAITPRWVLTWLAKKLSIEPWMDWAATDENAVAPFWVTRETNALRMNWVGATGALVPSSRLSETWGYAFPPGQWPGGWLKKAVAAWAIGGVQTVLLAPAPLSSAWLRWLCGLKTPVEREGVQARMPVLGGEVDTVPVICDGRESPFAVVGFSGPAHVAVQGEAGAGGWHCSLMLTFVGGVPEGLHRGLQVYDRLSETWLVPRGRFWLGGRPAWRDPGM